MKHYIFNQDLTESFHNEDHDLNNEIEKLEKDFFKSDQRLKNKAIKRELIRDLNHAIRNADQDLIEILQDEIEQLEKF